MGNNTKKRHNEIYESAQSAIAAAGGVAAIDALPLSERQAALRAINKQVAEAAQCHIETARASVAKAIRRARFEQVEGWGGVRAGAGRPKIESK